MKQVSRVVNDVMRGNWILAAVICASFLSIHARADAVQQAHAQGRTITVGLIGDSTVAGTYGWGPAFAEKCDDRTAVLNYAKNGATLDSLSGKLNELLKQLPDYVLIQFGHNDMKRYDSAAYAKKLNSYVDQIKKAGGQPVILSSVTRRNFDENGKIKPRYFQDDPQRSLPVFAKAAQELANERNLPFVDLYTISLNHHNRIGPEASAAYNYNKDDTTHFSKAGADAIAELIVAELGRVVSELAGNMTCKSSTMTKMIQSAYAQDLLTTAGRNDVEFRAVQGLGDSGAVKSNSKKAVTLKTGEMTKQKDEMKRLEVSPKERKDDVIILDLM